MTDSTDPADQPATPTSVLREGLWAETGSWRLPRQRDGSAFYATGLLGDPNSATADGRLRQNGSYVLVELVHWAPRDHRFRPYLARVNIDHPLNEKLSVWCSPENPLPVFLPWLHQEVGPTGATWTARYLYGPGLRRRQRWHLYFARREHADAFMERWRGAA